MTRGLSAVDDAVDDDVAAELDRYVCERGTPRCDCGGGATRAVSASVLLHRRDSVAGEQDERLRRTVHRLMMAPVYSSGATIVARIMGSWTRTTLSRPPGSGKSAGLSIVRSVPSLNVTVWRGARKEPARLVSHREGEQQAENWQTHA